MILQLTFLQILTSKYNYMVAEQAFIVQIIQGPR